MKKTAFIILALAMAGLLFSFCSNDDDDDDNNNNNSKIPDAVFNLNVSGAESHTFDFTLPGNVASDYAANGSHLSSQNMLSVMAASLPITWQYNLVADVTSLENGTYNLKAGMSAFTPPSQTTAYLCVSGTVTLSKTDLYQSVSSVEDWFVDGTFTGIYQDTNNPPNQVTISGSFSGINIKAQ